MLVRLIPVAAAALLLAGPAAGADRVVERGIVQSVTAESVVLRALDGTDVTIALGQTTHFRLNGRAVARGRITTGLVAEAVTRGNGPAIVLRAFGRVTPVVRTGVVVRVGPNVLVLRLGGGNRLRIPLTAQTVVRSAGSAVPRSALEPGARVRARIASDGAANVVTVVRR